MGLKQTTAPTVEPLSVEDAKLHCRVDGDDENTYIAGLVRKARRYIENVMGRQFCTATWTLKHDRFPSGGGELRLPRPPLSSVTSISYIDTAGDSQTWSSDEYDVDTYTEPGRVVEAYGYTWPTTRSDIDAVTIVYVAGYGGAVAVPDDYRHAIALLVAHWYALREPVQIGAAVNAVPRTVDSIIWSDRIAC